MPGARLPMRKLRELPAERPEASPKRQAAASMDLSGVQAISDTNDRYKLHKIVK